MLIDRSCRGYLPFRGGLFMSRVPCRGVGSWVNAWDLAPQLDGEMASLWNCRMLPSIAVICNRPERLLGWWLLSCDEPPQPTRLERILDWLGVGTC